MPAKRCFIMWKKRGKLKKMKSNLPVIAGSNKTMKLMMNRVKDRVEFVQVQDQGAKTTRHQTKQQ